MSKEFYKSSVVPTLLRRFSFPKITEKGDGKSSFFPEKLVEVWSTTCIVNNFGRDYVDAWANTKGRFVLINPSNPQLSGISKFPYFPRGGPVPESSPGGAQADWQPLGYVTAWGGMDVGTGMLYATSVVDGLVHLAGGWKLAVDIASLEVISGSDEKCPVGHAVETAGRGELKYDAVIHTTPPFYKNYDDAASMLRKCYAASLKLAFKENLRSGRKDKNEPGKDGGQTENGVVALPLLGAGGRGFPVDAAIDIAASECIKWITMDKDKVDVIEDDRGGLRQMTVAFGIPDLDVANALIDRMQIECECKF